MRPAVCPEQVASACVVLAAAGRVGIAAPVRLRKYIFIFRIIFKKLDIKYLFI